MKIQDIEAMFYDKNAGFWPDSIQGVQISATAAASTELGGQFASVGASSDYVLPTRARSIVAVAPIITATTPTAHQAFMNYLNVTSADLSMRNYQVLANPIDSALGTNITTLMDESYWYPLCLPCKGSEHMQFYGIPLINQTAAPWMAVNIMLSDMEPVTQHFGMGPIFDSIMGPITTTGTATGGSADAGTTISGPNRLIQAIYAQVCGTTPAASKPISGTMVVSAGELAVNPLKFQVEPLIGFLGTTTSDTLAHNTKMEWLNLACTIPTKIISTFYMDQSISTAGNFVVQYMTKIR